MYHDIPGTFYVFLNFSGFNIRLFSTMAWVYSIRIQINTRKMNFNTISIYQVLTMYIPCIYWLMVYTMYIHGIYIYMPVVLVYTMYNISSANQRDIIASTFIYNLLIPIISY
jgi:hypothetical protein